MKILSSLFMAFIFLFGSVYFYTLFHKLRKTERSKYQNLFFYIYPIIIVMLFINGVANVLDLILAWKSK